MRTCQRPMRALTVRVKLIYRQVMRALWWVPNALSGFRGFIAAPIIALVFLWEFVQRVAAFLTFNIWGPEILGNYLVILFWVTGAAAASDGIDGFLAKTFEKYGWCTKNGGNLDAYCDKFLGAAVLYVAIPLHYLVGWYLITYVPALWYIAWYSQTTTRMRWAKEIKRSNRLAQQKTYLLMVIMIIAMGNIAFVGSDEVLWVCVAGCVISAVMCRIALEQYKMAALITPSHAR